MVTLETERLFLRPLELGDIPQLVPLIGSPEVAATTLRIPHPYTEEHARQFIAGSAELSSKNHFGIFRKEDGQLLGGIGLRTEEDQQRAELGYWIGAPYWGKGYATESARAVVAYGFETLKFHRIYASHFQGNNVSGNVLRKLGMSHEGCQRGHILKAGKFLDSELFGLLRSDWESKNR